MRFRTAVLAFSAGLALCGLAGPAAAQNADKADLSAGYQFVNASPSKDTGGTSEAMPKGWYADLAANFTRSIAAVAEVGGNYKTLTESASYGSVTAATTVDLKIHEFMGGVRFSSRAKPSLVPFGHVLVGAAHISASGTSWASIEGQPMYSSTGSDSSTDLALQFGGGMNVGVTKRVGIRVGADYVRIFSENDIGTDLNVFRFNVGVNIPF